MALEVTSAMHLKPGDVFAGVYVPEAPTRPIHPWAAAHALTEIERYDDETGRHMVRLKAGEWDLTPVPLLTWCLVIRQPNGEPLAGPGDLAAALAEVDSAQAATRAEMPGGGLGTFPHPSELRALRALADASPAHGESLWAVTRDWLDELAGREVTDAEARDVRKAIEMSDAGEIVRDAVSSVCGGLADPDGEWCTFETPCEVRAREGGLSCGH
jgi:hypothetical protein